MKRTLKIAMTLCFVTLALLMLASCDLTADMFETFATTPEITTPEGTTPDINTPETTTPDVTTPSQTTPEKTTPEDTTDTTPPAEYLDSAAEYVYNLYKDLNITRKDFEITNKVVVGGYLYNIEWAVNTQKVTIEEKDENTYIVNVDEESSQELPYVLTAVVKASDGSIAVKMFNLTVPQYDLTTFEEYQAAREGEIVIIKGVVVAISSHSAGGRFNSLFLADPEGKGGYYSFNMGQDPITDLGIEVGMTVEVTGPISPYEGMQEIKGGTARITDATKKEIKPFDVTEKFANGESLVNYAGALVTIRGVEIKHQDLEAEANQYLYFSMGENTSYIRTYVAHFPSTLRVDVDETGALSSPDKTIIDAAHAEHFGWTANVTGIVTSYNSRQYLIPISVDCFEYLEQVSKTNDKKIADALGQLKFESAFNSNAVINLPAVSNAYPEVSFVWNSNNDSAVIANGQLNITTPDANTEVIITVTATCGDKTGSREFLFKLFKDIVPIKDIIDLGMAHEHNNFTTNKFLVAGTITEVYNEMYGDMKITDAEGNILTIYGTYNADGSVRYDAMEVKPNVGDYVVVWGIVGQYNGVPQVKQGWIVAHTAATLEFVLPVREGVLARNHSTDTPAFFPTLNEFRLHLGIDIATEEAAPVFAMAAGTVAEIWKDSMMGWCLALSHTGDVVTVYKNLSKQFADGITIGAKVEAGQLLGCVGDTAIMEMSEDPHLHLEMTIKGEQVDPLDYFSPEIRSALTGD